MTMDSRQILKRHGRSFHFASLFLSADHRDRAADLYAFCRQVDDIADEAVDKKKAWDELETIKTGLSKGANGANVRLTTWCDGSVGFENGRSENAR